MIGRVQVGGRVVNARGWVQESAVWLEVKDDEMQSLNINFFG